MATGTGQKKQKTTAHRTITVEYVCDHLAVVEREDGRFVCECCTDRDVLPGVSMEQVARAYAAMFEDDFVAGMAR